MQLAEIGLHRWRSAAVLVVAFTFFARGWIGGGDAKLAAATALWLGFDQLLKLRDRSSLFGGPPLLTLAILRFRAMPLPRCWQSRNGRSACIDGYGIPYASRSRFAALLIYPDTP